MTFNRVTGFAALLFTSAAVLCFSNPVSAGFEFTPSRSAAVQAAPSDARPMRIVPVAMPPFSEMPLDEAMMQEAAPDKDPVLANKVSRAQTDEQVYIRRQKAAIPTQANKAQPLDAETLLRATQPTSSSQALVINPYPLQAQANHDGGMSVTSVDQAMMEETGALRPVALPGYNNKAGMMARADISSRHNRTAAYKTSGASAILSNTTNITPIPGGEGVPLGAVEQEVLPPVAPPVVAATPIQKTAMAVPRSPTPESAAFGDAVGFGRDLPLALALSQVVPPDFSYAFAQGVNAGTTVSWQGGKPWNEVLNDMLAANGLHAVIQNNMVTIQPLSS